MTGFDCSWCYENVPNMDISQHKCPPRKERMFHERMDYLIKENNDAIIELMDHEFETREEMIENMEEDYKRLPEGLRIGGRLNENRT